MNPSQDNIQLAHAVATVIGIDPQVYAYHDDNKETTLHILNCKDPLDLNNYVYCTIGLSDFPNKIEMKDGSETNIPVELLLSGNRSSNKWANVLSAVGFHMTKNQWTCQPGAVFKNMVNIYHPDIALKHLLFVEPFMWQEKLDAMKLSSKKVYFLLLVPISDAECSYREKHGFDALEKLFMKHEIDITNLYRPSVL
jgi:hypothetical protein